MRKYLSLILSISVFLSCLALAACGSTRASSATIGQKGVTPVLVIYGDANDDGEVNMKDVLAIRLFVADGTRYINHVTADVNHDGSIDMKDVLIVRKFIANIEPLPTPPDPSESTDPTTTPGASTDPTDPTVTTAPSAPEDSDETSEPTLPPRTSTVRSTTQSTYHEPISFAGDPQIDFISGNETMGVWWWYLSDGLKLETREKYLDFLAYNHVTEIYYYCYDAITNPNRRSETHEFVQSAMSRGMRVAFMYDDKNSILETNTYVTDKLVPNYLAYKAEWPDDAVYGLHLDVEPKRNELQDYVDNFLVAEIQPARAQGVFVELDVNVNYGGYSLNFNGSKQNFYDIVAQCCDTMSLMSYRTRAEKVLSSTEAARASAKKYSRKVIFGIEMGDSGEGVVVDFSKSSKTAAYQVLREVDQTLATMDLPGGYGYAIHHARAWFNLKNE